MPASSQLRSRTARRSTETPNILASLKEKSDFDRKLYRVERSHVSIANLDRIEETLQVRPPSQVQRATHSAGIKRVYTPLLEKYKRSLVLPPDMTDEERDRVRRLRQDPFAKRSCAPKIHNLEESVAGAGWQLSRRVLLEHQDEVETPRSAATPRALKTSHRGISVVPVGKMANDISFRVVGPPVHSPRMSSQGSMLRMGRGETPGRPHHAPILPTPPPGHHAHQHHHQQQQRMRSRGVNGNRRDIDGAGTNDEAERMRCLVSFNELKRRAMLIDKVPPLTEVLSAEMFVRIEDDFMRVINGRRSRILLPGDFNDEIRLGGNTFTRRRLAFLMANEHGGEGVSFVQLFLYAFPCVSSAQIDSFMLRYSTSMNEVLGGPLEVRADPLVYAAIRSLFLKFDHDGDGIVTVEDIVKQQKKLHEASLSGGDDSGDVAEYEMASHHIHEESDGTVTLEAFALFSRFLFPPYKMLDL